MAQKESSIIHQTKSMDSMQLSRKSDTLIIQSLNITVHWPVALATINFSTTKIPIREFYMASNDGIVSATDAALVFLNYYPFLIQIFLNLFYTWCKMNKIISNKHKTTNRSCKEWCNIDNDSDLLHVTLIHSYCVAKFFFFHFSFH